MKRKYRRQIVYIHQSVHNEIDYDKLAEAIVKANNGLREADAPKEKIKIRKTIWLIIRNKKKSNGTVTSDFIGLIMSHFLISFL